MKLLQYIIVCSVFFSFAQQEYTLVLQDSVSIVATKFIGVDAYQSVYYIQDDVLYKKQGNSVYSYQNNSLGTITTVDVLNPLEIILFYQNFNTVVQLDNHLSEIKKVNFSFDAISWVALCSNHRLWRFNTVNLQLEVFNTVKRSVETITQPISQPVKQIKSNYNYCWVLTETEIIKYNNYGSLIARYALLNYSNFWVLNDSFLVLKNNIFYVYDTLSKTHQQLDLNKISIQDVYVKAETMYIYNGKKVYRYKIIKTD